MTGEVEMRVDLPLEVHRRAKVMSAERGQTLKVFVRELIERADRDARQANEQGAAKPQGVTA